MGKEYECPYCHGLIKFHRKYKSDDEDIIYEFYCSNCKKKIRGEYPDSFLKKEKHKIHLDKLEFIFKKIKESGTKSGIQQFIYTVEEIGEIAEVLRCIYGDVRKMDKDLNDLASEIGDTLITLYLITKFESLDFFDILDKAIEKEYNRWNKSTK